VALGVPCGPVNSMLDALGMDQVQARRMVIDMPHPLSSDPVRLVGSPLKFSGTPVSYRFSPPTTAQHQDLAEDLVSRSGQTNGDFR